MKVKAIYLGLCVLGVVLPYWQFVPWLVAKRLEYARVFPATFRQPHQRFFRHGCIGLRPSTIGLRPAVKGPGSARLGRGCRRQRAKRGGLSWPFLYMRERNLEQGRGKARPTAV